MHARELVVMKEVSGKQLQLDLLWTVNPQSSMGNPLS